MIDSNSIDSQTEKNSAALSSVVAAIGLTTFKVIVGVLTGSLGILAEAAHSGLDLVAALVTFFAVKLSSKPADKQHTYGHGKIENLSALFETLLLLGTCAWIIYEAVSRLTGKPVEVDISIWAFVVMLVSIAIDFTRSRILKRAAKKYNSQALEADALHFSTDIWSSCVVILGLILVKVSEYLPGIPWLKEADSVAALGVSAIVAYVSIEMGIRTVMALMDTSPEGMEQKVKGIVESIKGVSDCHKVRVRSSGPIMIADVHVRMSPKTSIKTAHEKTLQIQEKIRQEIPGMEITIHVEPVEEK